MGNSETLPRKMFAYATVGVEIGRAILTEMRESNMFFGGQAEWQKAAGIVARPVHPPEHFEPQNYPRLIQPEQGEK